MDITIKHFTHTGHSNWVLMNEDGEIVQRNGWQMAGRTRRLAETIALEFAEEMGFSTIRSEYYYGGTRRYKFIKKVYEPPEDRPAVLKELDERYRLA